MPSEAACTRPYTYSNPSSAFVGSWGSHRPASVHPYATLGEKGYLTDKGTRVRGLALKVPRLSFPPPTAVHPSCGEPSPCPSRVGGPCPKKAEGAVAGAAMVTGAWPGPAPGP